jgi:hypothetical protein
VLPSAVTGGTSQGAASLLDPEHKLATAETQPVAPLALDGFAGYAGAWREQAGG